jgi:drug/metabolite transporter (DMT)-like permease
MTATHGHSGARTGAALGVGAAALFGLSTPFAKRLLGATSPQVLAGLLYFGAGVALSLYAPLRGTKSEARLGRADLGTLGAIILFGGVIGPVLLLVGLTRVTAVVGSLLLNLEAPFTMAIAVAVFREHLGRGAAIAAGLIVAAATLLQVRPGDVSGDLVGVLCIALACACWAIDNNLTQGLSLRDPIAIVRAKTLAAGAFNLALALLLGQKLPSPKTTALALALGVASYGVSVVLDAYALRFVGAAREAAYFATAPFFGAIASVVVLGDRLSAVDVTALVAMGIGVVLMLRDRHGHVHAHEVLEHEHMHEHDEHHQHEHPPGTPTTTPHSHAHRHEPLVHEHPHVSDLHHRHRH